MRRGPSPSAHIIKRFQCLLPFLISIFFSRLNCTRFIFFPCFFNLFCSHCLSVWPWESLPSQQFSSVQHPRPDSVLQQRPSKQVTEYLMNISPVYTPIIHLSCSSPHSTGGSHLTFNQGHPQVLFPWSWCVTRNSSWGIYTAGCWGIRHSQDKLES